MLIAITFLPIEAFSQDSTTINITTGQEIYLDYNIRLTQPDTKFVIEVNSDFFFRGTNIKRFLVTIPGTIEVSRIDVNKLEVKATGYGTTFMHIWDDTGRWTFSIKIIPIRRLGEDLREAMQMKEIRRTKAFKIQYDSQRFAGFSGGRPNYLKRESLIHTHNLKLTGETPYGSADGEARLIRDENANPSLSLITAGLTDANFYFLDNFDIRALDFQNNFGKYVLPSLGLRGVNLKHRLLNNGIEYTSFWGRERQYGFSSISTGTDEINSYVGGGSVLVTTDVSTIKMTGVHAYGEDRKNRLNYATSAGYDLQGTYEYGDVTFNHDVAYDRDHAAGTAGVNYATDHFAIATEYRNIPKEFTIITGRPSQYGETGLLTDLKISSKDNILSFISDMDIYRDRAFPNPEKPSRRNFNFNSRTNLILSDFTHIRANYGYYSREGSSSPSRAYSHGVSLHNTVDIIRPIGFSINYRRAANRNLTTPSGDYIDNRMEFNVNLDIIDNLNFYALEEVHILRDLEKEDMNSPTAFETGISYRGNILRDIYLNLSFNYRTENSTKSENSFMVGEDSATTSGEIIYRPSKDFELFSRAFVRVTKSETDPDAPGNLDVQYWIGGRYLFETPFSWNPQARIEGYVFKDYNGNDIMDEGDEGIPEAKIFIGNNEAITDERGHYLFGSISGKEAQVCLDPTTLPLGFMPVKYATKTVSIEHGKREKVNFGVVTKSEIYGTVFVDSNDNGDYEPEEETIVNVSISLDDKIRTKTNSKGRYYIRNVIAGKHVLKMDLNSIPITYMPKVSLTKRLEIFEGVTYIYNIPLKKIKNVSND